MFAGYRHGGQLPLPAANRRARSLLIQTRIKKLVLERTSKVAIQNVDHSPFTSHEGIKFWILRRMRPK